MPTAKPNIVFILIDDMGWRDISLMGSEFYETPNIDKIGESGITFTDAYAACPVCSPTRASIMTGKYPARLGLTNYIGGPDHCKTGGERGKLLSAPYIPYLPATEQSIAKTLKANGYKTWHIGKWHLGTEEFWPEHHGFDINIGGCHMGSPRTYFAPWSIPTLESKQGDEYLTDRLGDEAARLIRENDGTPFFLNMCFYSVHMPAEAKKEKIEKYKRKAKEMGLDKINALIEGDFFPCEHKKHLRIIRRVIQSDPVYAAMIEHLDENVGKILDALENKGIANDTIVIFTSDNGGLATAESSPTCNKPLSEGKGWMYEGGTRVPLLIRWPETIASRRKSEALVTSTDFYPTLLELCGLNLMPEQHCDGKSFASLLRDESADYDRGSIFWHYPHYGNQGGEPACSILKGKWKLIEFFDGPVELYNLEEDISENNNLKNQFPDIADNLLKELYEWKSDVNALIPEKNSEWKPWRFKDLNPLE